MLWVRLYEAEGQRSQLDGVLDRGDQDYSRRIWALQSGQEAELLAATAPAKGRTADLRTALVARPGLFIGRARETNLVPVRLQALRRSGSLPPLGWLG